MSGGRLAGTSAIALGVGFNVPYAALAVLYDYPQILRRPAGEALARFAEGGPALVLAWYGFTLAALALIPVAAMLAATPAAMARRPTLAVGAAVAGALAGLAQAVGLSRWVFVVPALARASDRPAAARAFDILNAYGGVAVGEHIGQLLTALFAFLLTALQRHEGHRRLAWLGRAAGAGIAIGTGEGLALALGLDSRVYPIATIAGFVALSGWLIATGHMLQRAPRVP